MSTRGALFECRSDLTSLSKFYLVFGGPRSELASSVASRVDAPKTVHNFTENDVEGLL